MLNVQAVGIVNSMKEKLEELIIEPHKYYDHTDFERLTMEEQMLLLIGIYSITNLLN